MKKILKKTMVMALVLCFSFSLINVEAFAAVKIKQINPIEMNLTTGQTVSLPKTVSAKMSNGKTQKVAVTWSVKKIDTSMPGRFTYSGKVKSFTKGVKLNVTISLPTPTGLSVDKLATGYVHIMWNTVNNASEYKLYMKINGEEYEDITVKGTETGKTIPEIFNGDVVEVSITAIGGSIESPKSTVASYKMESSHLAAFYDMPEFNGYTFTEAKFDNGKYYYFILTSEAGADFINKYCTEALENELFEYDEAEDQIINTTGQNAEYGDYTMKITTRTLHGLLKDYTFARSEITGTLADEDFFMIYETEE